MENYDDFLVAFDQINNEPSTSKRQQLINVLTGMLDTLDLSIKGKKLNVNFDDTSEDDLLICFSGSNDIEENEQKLKVLKMKLKQLNSNQS